MSLARIASGLGVLPTEPERHAAIRPASTQAAAKEFMQHAAQAGVAVMEGRPNDPMLDIVGW